jgi:hypothetical protein
MDILSSYPYYTTKRSCFAKHFFKTDSGSSEYPLHQQSHNRSSAKHTLLLHPCLAKIFKATTSNALLDKCTVSLVTSHCNRDQNPTQ